MANQRIIAVGLLTQRDLEALGANFVRLWPVDETPCFSLLLQAIDEADRELWRERDETDGLGAPPAPQANKMPNPT